MAFAFERKSKQENMRTQHSKLKKYTSSTNKHCDSHDTAGRLTYNTLISNSFVSLYRFLFLLLRFFGRLNICEDLLLHFRIEHIFFRTRFGHFDVSILVRLKLFSILLLLSMLLFYFIFFYIVQCIFEANKRTVKSIWETSCKKRTKGQILRVLQRRRYPIFTHYKTL